MMLALKVNFGALEEVQILSSIHKCFPSVAPCTLRDRVLLLPTIFVLSFVCGLDDGVAGVLNADGLEALERGSAPHLGDEARHVLLSMEMKEPFVSEDESIALPRVLGRGHRKDEDKDGIDVVQIGDDETVTMMDIPQMVSVSHRDAQMYFDRYIGCIYKFFDKRFNLAEKGGQDGSEIDDDDSGRPSFLSIQNTSGALEKELAASGFTKKEQVEIEKFIDENAEENDSNSDDDDDADVDSTSEWKSEGGDTVSAKINSL